MEVYATWGRTRSSPGCANYGDRPPIVYDAANWNSAQHHFAVFHGANWWRFLVDGNEIRQPIFEDAVCWTKQSAQWFAESLDIGDPLGGPAANKFRMQQMAWTESEAPAPNIGNWVYGNFNPANTCNIGPGSPDINGPPFFCDIVASDTIDIWTNR
jgi:hypothetical protein